MNGHTIRSLVWSSRLLSGPMAKRSLNPSPGLTDRSTPPRLSMETADERGMALIGVMLVMSLMVMLALAVTFTALSDHSITSNFRNGASGFYAAEAGINNVHRLL